MMERDVLGGAKLYRRSRRQGDDLVLQEKDVFLFQPPARSGREAEEPKSGEFQRF
jgi:hypothetical protein